MLRLKVHKNEKASKSITYFSQDQVSSITPSIVSQLELLASKELEKNIRICLHGEGDNLIQRMVILERRGPYYPPHCHKGRDEMHLVLKGSLLVFFLDDRGNPNGVTLNSEGSNSMTFIPSGTSHLTIPLSPVVTYLEIKNGSHVDFATECFTPTNKDGDEIESSTYAKLLENYAKSSIDEYLWD